MNEDPPVARQALTPILPSATQRGNGSARDPEAAGASPESAELAQQWAKVRELALRHLDRFVSLEPKVLRGDDSDAIHDLRVASRRLQEVIDLLYVSPRPPEIRKARRKIRRCRQVLSELRNCDVMLERVERALGRKRTSRREAWEALGEYLMQRRSQTADKALRKLSKVNLAAVYLHLKHHFVSSLDMARNGHGHMAASPGLESEFFSRVSTSLERQWQAFQAQIEESHRDRSAPVIHRVRIAAKRLRYSVEVIHEFEVAGSADVLAWLRRLQQRLGDWHDLEILEEMMIDMVARPEFLRNHLKPAMEVERLILRNRSIKRGLVEEYLPVTLDSADHRRIKQWVGQLLSAPPAALSRS